ncbi:MAG: acetolactate synthase small subunit [Bdellovibrionales bacterium]|nr:acetolactate synthase small subunit [Bdellovibrionales bacterium]
MATKRYTLSIFTENSPGVLQRITIMFTRRKLNIDSVTVSETERRGVSRFTIVLEVDGALIQKIAKQIRRIIEVLHVDVFEEHEIIAKELAFIRVEPVNDAEREEILAIVQQTEARIIKDEEQNIVLEFSGTREETDALCDHLTPFRLTEFVRSGRIAIPKKGVTHEEAIRLAV